MLAKNEHGFVNSPLLVFLNGTTVGLPTILAFQIDQLEIKMLRISLHAGFFFFWFLFAFMMYLQPLTRLEKAATFMSFGLALVFSRIMQVEYLPGMPYSSWFGAFAWTSLIASFFYMVIAITQSQFGRKGRHNIVR